MGDVLRIIDANANRAREAMRVMEEAARFVLDDSILTEQCKQLRHDLADTLAQLGPLPAHRDTPGDVGTNITLPSEQSRASVTDVAIAAGRRLSEALRAIEEYAKVVDTSVAAGVEQLRYRGYELERHLSGRLPNGAGVQWRVCVLLSESLCVHGSWDEIARQVVDAGADCIQLREKNLGDAELLRRARLLREITSDRTALVINDRPDMALLAHADGVHVGQGDVSIADVRRLAGRRLIVGVSTHDRAEAHAAVLAGADVCGVGAMFASQVKPDQPPSGPEYLREFLRNHPQVPHLAIGGINEDNISQLIDCGCAGVAVSSAVLGASDPAAVVASLLSAIANHTGSVQASRV